MDTSSACTAAPATDASPGPHHAQSALVQLQYPEVFSGPEGWQQTHFEVYLFSGIEHLLKKHKQYFTSFDGRWPSALLKGSECASLCPMGVPQKSVHRSALWGPSDECALLCPVGAPSE